VVECRCEGLRSNPGTAEKKERKKKRKRKKEGKKER
jgi:hypothetical protein